MKMAADLTFTNTNQIKMPILNYTTKIDSIKTIMEIQQLIIKHGAKKMIIDNDDKGQAIALTFFIDWQGSLVAFSLPCNFNGVKKSMDKNKKVPRRLINDEQALRVGWRIVKDWVSAQLAIVEAELATMPEVFLPYIVTKSGDTLYKHVQSNKSNILLER